MAALTDNRKRNREDDPTDFVPLSKRINNLHINGVQIPIINHQLMYNNNAPCASAMQYVSDDSSGSGYRQIEETPYNEYSPELNQDQNPYYYNKNKLLYDLHAERLRRFSGI